MQNLCCCFFTNPLKSAFDSGFMFNVSTSYLPGGGKTLAFYYPLFYHWQPGISNQSQKTILVLGPLNRLLGSQADSLNAIGVPAVAMTQETADLDESLKVCIGVYLLSMEQFISLHIVMYFYPLTLHLGSTQFSLLLHAHTTP